MQLSYISNAALFVCLFVFFLYCSVIAVDILFCLLSVSLSVCLSLRDRISAAWGTEHSQYNAAVCVAVHCALPVRVEL